MEYNPTTSFSNVVEYNPSADVNDNTVSGPSSKKPKIVREEFNILDQIQNKITKTVKEKKEHENISGKKKGSNHIEALCQVLNLTIGSDLKGTDLSTIEVEVRFGEVSGEGFHPGIRKEDFKSFCNILEHWEGSTCIYTKESDYSYEQSLGKNMRITYDELKKKCLSAQTKTRHSNTDLELPALKYDCRISVSTEVHAECPTFLPDNYTTKREKSRWSYTIQGMAWKIELTEVNCYDAREYKETVYEMEFEFLGEVVTLAAHQEIPENREKLKSVSSQYWKFVKDLVDRLGQSNDPHYYPSLHLEKVSDAERDELRRMCVDLIPGLNPSQTRDFPGSMPVNFSRRYIPLVQSKSYFVSEKTDGIRYMMLVNQNGVFFTDRKFDFYFVHGFEILVELYSSHGITLLDGEMVRHIPTNGPMYLVFDVLAFDGERVGEQPLQKRLSKIAAAIKPYREALEQHRISDNHPFQIMGKPFNEKKDIRKLLQNIKTVKGERYFQDGKRHHKTDGIIFTPDDPYRARTCHNLFKWKYMDKLSIDLKVTPKSNGTLAFACIGSEGFDIEYNLNMKSEDLVRLQRDIPRQKDLSVVIAECSYDHWQGNWNYQMIRTDKNRPNHIRVVFDTLEVISENVSVEEIVYRLSVDHAHDDWKAKVQHSLQQILEQQYHQRHQQNSGHSTTTQHKH